MIGWQRGSIYATISLLLLYFGMSSAYWYEFIDPHPTSFRIVASGAVAESAQIKLLVLHIAYVYVDSISSRGWAQDIGFQGLPARGNKVQH